MTPTTISIAVAILYEFDYIKSVLAQIRNPQKDEVSQYSTSSIISNHGASEIFHIIKKFVAILYEFDYIKSASRAWIPE